MKSNPTLIILLIAVVLSAGSAVAGGRCVVSKHITPSIRLPDSTFSAKLVSYAQTLIGVPYRAASANPLKGFDCSGFVNYVFKKFNVKVPRSSEDFVNAGEKVSLADAKPGDVIIFTGTPTYHPHSVGHIGIVLSNEKGLLKFIHSTSGKEYGVTITTMGDGYKRRFIQVVRFVTDAFL